MAQDFLQRVLLVVDATEPSQRAVDMALGLAAQVKAAQVVIAYIIDTDLLGGLLDRHVLVQDEMDGLVEDFEAQGKRLFQQYQEQAKVAEVALKPIICQGRLYQVVLHCIDKYQCEAVVIDFGRDSHRQGDFHNERQLGLDQARVPVFVV